MENLKLKYLIEKLKNLKQEDEETYLNAIFSVELNIKNNETLNRLTNKLQADICFDERNTFLANDLVDYYKYSLNGLENENTKGYELCVNTSNEYDKKMLEDVLHKNSFTLDEHIQKSFGYFIWTNKYGIYMPIKTDKDVPLIAILQKYLENFDIDENIDFLREHGSYKSLYNIEEMIYRLKNYVLQVQNLINDLKELEG